MTIYILDNNYQVCAEYLDDKSLSFMIKDIAKVLSLSYFIHYERQYDIGSNRCVEDMEMFHKQVKDCPVFERFTPKQEKWAEWIIKCKAHYVFLMNIGLALCEEYKLRFTDDKWINIKMLYERFSKTHPYEKIIKWAKKNIPDLPYLGGHPRLGIASMEEIPLIMPKENITYRLNSNFIYGNSPTPVIIESYRKYYQAKLKQKQCMEHDACIYAQQNNCLRTKPHWTHREKPDWLDLN